MTEVVGLIVASGALLISAVTLFVVVNQLKAAAQQVQLALAANQRIGEGERLLATHQLITKLETDREYLEARQFFASVRDNKIAGKTILGIIDKYLDNGAADATAKKDILDDYQKLIRHLNIMEITSVGIATGCYDEEALKLWQRGPYVRNFTAALPAITKLRQHNQRPRLFVESEKLACYWAEDGTQSENLGITYGQRKQEFKTALDKLRSPNPAPAAA
jgi:hypothetical protein